jgi:cellulose synthase/poly-beta-1,6-N-acetylglucosamine synthase-like glycosyltransferase
LAVLASAILAPIAAWVFLIAQLGWGFGLLLGWVFGPIAAVMAAALVMVWTIPLRSSDILSLHRRFRPATAAPVEAEPPRVSISVIMPVFNAHSYLLKSLPPLMEALRRGELEEVIVVDDGATDGSAELARSMGARVMPSGGRKGPGAARNLAAAIAKGEVLWFIDADVVVHADTVHYVRSAYRDPETVAVFGSYDNTPPELNFGSQYKNLVHHHYHQNSNPSASTFWSGCGAVRKAAFLAAGGFDANVYKNPSIEDVELGYRLRSKGGKILLDRRLLSTHLKFWTIVELVRTDIFRRALPWARLMLQKARLLDDMNVGTAERLRAALAGLTVLAVAAAIFKLIPAIWLIPVLLTTLTANWHLFMVFYRARGLAFGLCGLAFHQIYYLYSTAAFLWCWLEVKLPRRQPA